MRHVHQLVLQLLAALLVASSTFRKMKQSEATTLPEPSRIGADIEPVKGWTSATVSAMPRAPDLGELGAEHRRVGDRLAGQPLEVAAQIVVDEARRLS